MLTQLNERSLKLITIVLIYKIINIFGVSASASTIIMPLWFILGDVIAEVYGYKIAKNLIWLAIFCQFIFAFSCSTLASLPSPIEWTHQGAYDQVFHKLPRVAFASFIAILFGAFINAYAVSKWKILLKGKYFWLRSLGASAVGELVFTMVAYFVEFFGVVPLPKILHLMIISYVIKLALNPVLVIPSAFLAMLLKKIEDINLYDVSISFDSQKVKMKEYVKV